MCLSVGRPRTGLERSRTVFGPFFVLWAAERRPSYTWRMPIGLRTRLLARGIGRVPGLKRLPLFKVLAVAEIAIMARDHLGRLEPGERRRLLELVRQGRGRGRNLAPEEREELTTLVAKVEPRRFAGMAADRLSPVPLPRRITHGPRDRR